MADHISWEGWGYKIPMADAEKQDTLFPTVPSGVHIPTASRLCQLGGSLSYPYVMFGVFAHFPGWHSPPSTIPDPSVGELTKELLDRDMPIQNLPESAEWGFWKWTRTYIN